MTETNPNLLDPKDAEHLKLLAIFHYVAAGLAFAGLAFMFIHFLFFKMMMSDPAMLSGAKGGPPPQAIFTFMKVVYAGMGLFFVAYAVGNLLSAKYLKQRRHRMFSYVMAALNCLHIPIGTTLGVFTIIVLSRDSVLKAYGDA
ncbi:hypothetical protein [Verrucomicrobium sp. BvORR106]|uniref:hypothetical protein n=1 Tax=Verrucomicrobium sp. BvORR106 TaxID=1403819 RepID=UPI00056E0157|nr:hypothetical protein [Verrucomicrobium sp. BvORR106]